MGITRYFSYGEEATFGTPALAVETIDPESAELDPSGDQALIYEGVSRLDRTVAPAFYRSEGSLSTPVDLTAFAWFLKWALGGYTVTGTAPSFTHHFFPEQSALMKSFTARVGKDVFEHIFTGCVVDSLSLELDDGFFVGSVDIAGGADQKGTLQANPTFTQGEIYAPHQVTAEINGVDESATIEKLSIKIETGADNEAGRTIGSRFPRRAYRGAFSVEIELGLSFFSTMQLERFWGTATGPSTNKLTEIDTVIHVGDNMDILIPRAVYTAMSQPLSGRDRIEQTATIRALVKADGTGPIEFSITNNKASYTPV
ncbi:phage tail tube protein [Shimazuella sp. AN120528]|uniref:phage tail tube protein n=1 Tax=Shimazuella soli TaxID=1892854 RepID=UPI001F0F1243|nr:phage tail tube protein [Shimazuella soli]MCH5586316.1 phage tail tube protein [Shimazuella soli]